MFALRRGFVTVTKQVRNVHTNDILVDNLKEVVNRNPRNLELLRIARKPQGFFLDDLKLEFWHKLELKKHARHITAEVKHHENGVVLIASSREGGLMKQLYSLTDVNAYMNIGTLIARRCLESGIFEVRCDLNAENSEKINLFMKAAEKAGLKLSESSVYRNPLPQTLLRFPKPWEVHD